MIYCVYILIFFISAPPCEPGWDKEEVKQLIDNIESKIILNKLESFYCKYSRTVDMYFLYSRLYGPPDEEIHKTEEAKEIAWIGKIGHQNYFYHSDFNLITPKKTPKVPLPLPPSKKDTTEPPHSLLELLKSKLEEQEVNYYQYTQSKLPEEENHPIAENLIALVYDGKPYNVYVCWYENGIIETKSEREESYPANIYFFSFFGQLGPVVHSYKFNWGVPLISFLKSPGPYYISKEEEYTKLWHIADIQEPISGDKFPLEIEIWLDSDYKIFRIDKVSYPSRTNDRILFPKANYNGPIDCNTPKLLHERLQIDEYFNCGENLYLPVKAFCEEYHYDTANELGKKIEIEYIEGKLSIYDYCIASTQIPRKVNYREEIIIDKESVKVNEPLPLDFFKPPEEISIESDAQRNQYLNIFLFVSGCVVFTLIAMFIMRRYFGWGL